MHRENKRRWLTVYAGFAVFFTVGFVLNWLVGWQMARTKNISGTVQVRADDTAYQFINPLLYSDNAASPTFNSLKSTLNASIESLLSEGLASSTSVYFRDLDNGQWTGVNENAVYDPSSMLKVIVMMAALKLAEQDPSIMAKKLYYAGPDQTNQNYPPDDHLSPGNYSVSNLLTAMIRYSDNGAFKALRSDAEISKAADAAYDLFRLTPSTSLVADDFLSPKSYAVVFRILYNSTFFEWSYSDQALNLLTHTTFDVGLVAGVPSTIAVAHKFGEHTFLLPDGTAANRELHDCGIIYYPSHPYLLCVMTKGSDFTALSRAISGISKTVYAYVASSATMR